MPVIIGQVWAMTKLLMTHPALCGQTSWAPWTSKSIYKE